MLHARRDPTAAVGAVEGFVKALLDKQRSEAGLAPEPQSQVNGGGGTEGAVGERRVVGAASEEGDESADEVCLTVFLSACYVCFFLPFFSSFFCVCGCVAPVHSSPNVCV